MKDKRDSVTVQWDSTILNDMLADSILAIIAQLQSTPQRPLQAHSHHHGHPAETDNKTDEESSSSITSGTIGNSGVRVKVEGVKEESPRSNIKVKKEDGLMGEKFDKYVEGDDEGREKERRRQIVAMVRPLFANVWWGSGNDKHSIYATVDDLYARLCTQDEVMVEGGEDDEEAKRTDGKDADMSDVSDTQEICTQTIVGKQFNKKLQGRLARAYYRARLSVYPIDV